MDKPGFSIHVLPAVLVGLASNPLTPHGRPPTPPPLHSIPRISQLADTRRRRRNPSGSESSSMHRLRPQHCSPDVLVLLCSRVIEAIKLETSCTFRESSHISSFQHKRRTLSPDNKKPEHLKQEWRVSWIHMESFPSKSTSWRS